MHKLAILIDKLLHKLYKTKTVSSELIWSYIIKLWIKLVISWMDITFDIAIAVFSALSVVLKLQQSMLVSKLT